MGDPAAPRYVSYDRWEAEHAGLVRRVAILERQSTELAGSERIHRELTDRISALEKSSEEQWKDQRTQEAEHRSKIWQAILAVVTGLVLPLVLLGAAAIFHLATRH